MLRVIKIGGNVVDNPAALEAFLDDLGQLADPFVLVHGGGKVATKISAALGIETQMVEGRRVTDAETLKIVTMVYAGLVNKTVVAGLQKRDVNAIGLSGADGNAIQSHKRVGSKVDYGFVGDVDKVNAGLLASLLEQNFCPVMAPITHDKQGNLLNTNADTVASQVASALGEEHEVELVYCFELPGVLRDIEDPSSLVSSISEEQYADLKYTGVVAGGMIPKLDNCFAAVANGVKQVRICQADALVGVAAGKSPGTVMHA